MGFIDSYKRLEKLCGDILNDDRRISAYIEEMLNTPRGAYLIRGWDDDLKRLKHYRWVRNQIVHDPNCSEENMCDSADTQWIISFYSRIMNQTDPLTLYCKKTQERIANSANVSAWQSESNYSKKSNKSNGTNGCALLFFFVIVIFLLFCLVSR